MGVWRQRQAKKEDDDEQDDDEQDDDEQGDDEQGDDEQDEREEGREGTGRRAGWNSQAEGEEDDPLHDVVGRPLPVLALRLRGARHSKRAIWQTSILVAG